MKANSITLMTAGICLLAIALFVKNVFVQYPLLFTSIILNLIAIVKSVREKREKEKNTITMKIIKLLPVLLLFVLGSCSSVRVYNDYDKSVDFSQYKTFAFYKTGIDKVEISDLDKKRILRAIETELTAKGFTKSENPDLLVNIFTKSREEVDVNTFHAGWGYGWGWGWNPWMFGGNQTSVSRSTEGTLFIDLIDAKKKEMIWQGEGDGYLTKNPDEKDERAREFVQKILQQYPPKKK